MLDVDLWLIGSRFRSLRHPALAPVRYVEQSLVTAARIIRRRPSGFVVMQPPVFVLALVVLLAGRRPVVADFHHDPFEERKWRWSLRPSLWLARRCALSLVTNDDHAGQLRAAGAAVAVLHDPPLDAVAAEASGDDRTPFVLVPSSYSPDEPVELVLAAARRLPTVEFRFTGHAPPALQRSAPDNVSFTGFVDEAAYGALVAGCSAILCLTDKPNTMQRGGYEALSAHRPLVTADSAVLRDYFGDAAVYADPTDADSIADAVDGCLSTAADRRRRMGIRHGEIVAEYPERLAPVRRALGEPLAPG